jgi:hypothetical protein
VPIFSSLLFSFPIDEDLYENKDLPFNINMLRCHIVAGARHAVPCPVTCVSANFMNMQLRFHHSLCPSGQGRLYENRNLPLNIDALRFHVLQPPQRPPHL